MKPMLEICCGDIASVIAACKGGSDRIELCSALDVGGVTPSLGLIEHAVKYAHARGVKVHVLVRPRPGDFAYAAEELEIMKADIAKASEYGVDGVVIGALTLDGDVDPEAMKSLMEAADGLDVTFHRAFDVCRDPSAALEQIIAMGCSRILTSGCRPTALDGADNLRRLNEQAGGRIMLIAGAEVTPQNAAEIIRASGVSELHASARASHTSPMRFRRGEVSMGKPGVDEYAISVTDPVIVKLIKYTMQNL